MLTGEDYRATLNDGRQIYFDGERVESVTDHHIFKRAIDVAAAGYDRFYDPAPEAISAYLDTPDTIEELREHADTKVDPLTSTSYSSLMTLLTSADRIADIRPDGSEAIRNYVKEVQQKDLRIVECITDAKGDRGKRPSQQEDKDAYLRVVQRRDDGVVIRGAKLHISSAAIAHELMTIPTKSMKPGEEEYAIACAVPVNAPGVKIVNVTSEPRGEDLLDAPISADAHAPMGFVIYEDVFVPNERIFLNGETAAAGSFAHALGLWVRINGLKNMADEADLMVGFAQLITEANGLDRVAHIKDKIAGMVIHATLIRATLEAAVSNSTVTEGVVVPDELYANAGKYQGAAYRQAMIQQIQDIAGGSLVTAPSTRDLDNPEIGDMIRKYMGTRQEIDGAYRTRLFLALRDFAASGYSGHNAVSTIQAGGGLFAQRVVTRSRYDMDKARRMALEKAGLDDPWA
ncbi:MAG: 4-hydroxyphenylacetate 3-hydroxylase [Gammaproteobacteria bacterium]|nr:4-hydroxyphenylacetate 3-hydroxylase [Gammaproteobacteria bacterium]